MRVMTESDFISAVKVKRIPTLRQGVTCADLSMQELEIDNAIHDCGTLGKVEILLDRLITYVAMNKSRMNSEV